MLVKNILGVNSFFMVNKKIVAECGMEAAMFLAILADATDIFDGEWCYQTQPTVESLSHGFLTRRRQDAGIRSLLDKGIIEQKNMGIPMKRYFRINKDKLLQILSEE